jgi:hypothetical protein
MTRKVNGLKVSTIIRQTPRNGLPKWVKEVAATRGYADALEPISMWVKDSDIETACELAAHGDGSSCVMSQASKRMGAENVYFFRNYAWVDFGHGPIVRFKTGNSIYTNVIDPFDRGDRDGIASGMYHLLPPAMSESLLRRREYGKNGKTAPDRRGGGKKTPVMHTERVVMASRA